MVNCDRVGKLVKVLCINRMVPDTNPTQPELGTKLHYETRHQNNAQGFTSGE